MIVQSPIKTFFGFQDGLFLITKIDEESNPAVMDVKYDLLNDGIHSTLINITFKLLRPLLGSKCYLRASMASNKSDRQYDLEIINTVFDVAKLMKGVSSNMMIRSFLVNYYKAIDFDPKFPIPTVRISYSSTVV